MKRRNVLKLLGMTSGALVFSPWRQSSSSQTLETQIDDPYLLIELEKLRKERAVRAEVKTERGGPRLFINGEEAYPLFALSAELLKTVRSYREAGINLLAPILGLTSAWVGPEKFEWEKLDIYFLRLLAINPDVYFLPRLHLNAPRWWKESHPEEMIRYGLPYDENEYKMKDRIGESGMNWNANRDLYDVSLASELWRKETGAMLRTYLRHIENSPLKARMLGYQVTSGMTAEWHYVGSRHLPDYSEPMEKACSPVPAPEDRLSTKYGLLRDPSKEKEVIDFYRCFHQVCAETILFFAGIVKEETKRRILCGSFYTYLLENICIQEAGHLAPQKILNSADIDFIACPYTYQHTNIEGLERWESDIIDEAGNWLGRARGVAGDGGYRVLTESLKRYGKLFIVEMDPSTYLEPKRAGEGGSGHETVEGSLRIIRRDLGNMFANGVGGWFLDFGHLVPPFEANKGWYDDEPIIKEIHRFVELGQKRKELDISSPSQILALYDAKSFFVTSHWKSEEPWEGYGISVSDFFNHWFCNSQARTLHRIGAPVDYMYRFDLKPEDAKKYKLILMVNNFFLNEEEVNNIKNALTNSQTTVVWFYAPGFVSPANLNLEQMEALTGFRFKVMEDPGPMMIRSQILEGFKETNLPFGIKKSYFPRFSVTDPEAKPLGYWMDNKEVAFAWKRCEGWNSVYVGTAPFPVEILRWLAQKAGASLWSSHQDIIYATMDAVCVIATERGKHSIRLPRPMVSMEGGPSSTIHLLDMDFGEVKIFIAPPKDQEKKSDVFTFNGREPT
jgi:hypothetical protein